MRWHLAALVALLSCGVIGSGGDSRPKAKPAPVPKCVHDEHSTIELVTQLEACEAAAKQAPPPAVVVTKLVQAGPKQCAGSPPSIAPVDTSECAPGMVCLDAKAQRALARNLAEYESWTRRVMACEGEAK